MKLVWHLFRKDFRHFRGRWAFWLGILLLKTLLGLALVHSPHLPADPLRLAGHVLIVLVTTEVALVLLLAALIVQDDPPLGAHPPWRTRPIAGARLLAAKALALVLMLGLPAVVLAAPLWLACGISLREFAWAAAGQLAVQAILVVPAASLGVLTGTLGRFLIGVLLCLLALPLAFAPLLAGNLPLMSGGRPAEFAAGLVLVFALVPPAVAAFVERRRGRLVAVGAVSLAVSAAILLTLDRETPASLAGGPVDEPLGSEAGSSGLELEFDSIRGRAVGPGQVTTLAVTVRVHGLPEGLGTYLRPLQQELSWADGTVSVQAPFPGWSSAALPDRQVREVLGIPPATGPVSPERLVFGFSPGADAADRLRGLPATYRLLAEVILVRPETTVRSLEDLRHWQVRDGRGARTLGVVDRGQSGSGVELLATEFITPASSVWSALLHRAGDGRDRLARVSFLNRRTGRGAPVVSREEGMVTIAGVRFFRLNLMGDLSKVAPGSDDVDLCWLEWSRVAVVRREIVVPGVRVSGGDAR